MTPLLRDGLLEGRSVALAGAVPESVGELLAGLGARLEALSSERLEDEDRALEWARSVAPVDVLVCGSEALADVDTAWIAVRAVANGALIPAGAGAIVLLGPRPEAAVHTEAVRDALENLARTLSVEWARYGITATAVAPGSATTDRDLATLIAFLSSAAGGYLSGCRFELNPLG
jgi:NAD(P)-dependent dehydrogenase (short-subunit alcohol dehydrogenase family)